MLRNGLVMLAFDGLYSVESFASSNLPDFPTVRKSRQITKYSNK
mgnify:CR=1 FL=1